MFPWLSPFPLILAEDDAGPQEVLVPDAAPAPAGTAPAVVPEEAFPAAAALDALYAELSAPPPGPDLALRQEVAALAGLDATIAADAALFAATLAALPPPAPEADPVPEVSPAPWPAWDWEAMSRDWGDPSRGWILG
jgi:hypothetical protein